MFTFEIDLFVLFLDWGIILGIFLKKRDGGEDPPSTQITERFHLTSWQPCWGTLNKMMISFVSFAMEMSFVFLGIVRKRSIEPGFF